MLIKLLAIVFILVLTELVPNVHSLNCISCSSDGLSQCATLQLTSGQLPSVTCAEGTESCYTYVQGETTVRGCELPITNPPTEFSSCSEDNCNANIYPENRIKCHKCTGANCLNANELTEAVPCQNYKEDDQCFTYLFNNVATRGCLSENENMVSRCEDELLCSKCTGDSCNGKTIEDEYCVVCDSTTDINCVSNLSETMQERCPTSAGGMGCFRFDDGGEIIKRGCLSSILAVEVVECRREGEFCKTCIGNNCNAKVNFEVCRYCNSTTDVSCIRSPGSVASVTCENYLDRCFVHVENNEVTRGCVSEQSTIVQNQCAQTSGDVCETCTGTNNCNNKIIDGEFCMDCDSQVNPNCRTSLNHTMRVQCNLAVRPLGCYLFDDGGDIIKRGCINNDLHAGEVSMCRQQGQFCKTCYGNDCNTKLTFQQCRSCTSATDVNCIRSGGSASQITCRDYMDTCYVHVQNDTVVRGCLAQPTTPTAVQTECRRTNSDLCETCSGNNCNGFLIDGEFCLTCDSQIDPNCQDNLNHTMRTQCNLGVRRLGCYRFDDTGGIIKRGCLSHLIPEEISYCRQQGQFCKTCLGDDCNAKIAFQECKVCTSTQNVDCIRSAHYINSTVCRNYLDECFVHVEDNIISRGCLQQNPGLESDCRDPDMCESCDDRGNCNDKIVDGEFCMTCDSQLDPNCVDNVNVSMRTQCSLAVTRMGCYLFDDGGEIIKRGCLSDIHPDEVTMCRQEGQFCKTCLGNDCNTKLAFQECKSCNSSQNVDCIRSTHYIDSVTCRNYLDNCFTHVQNNQTIRGCLQQNPSFENDCRNPDVCNSCDDRDNCNDAIVDGEFCMTCDSQLDPNCIDNLNVSMRTQCSLSVRGMGCYLFDDGGEIVKRGCLSDLIPEEVSMCRQQGQFCKTCTGNDCNTKETFQRCRSCTSATDVNCIRSGGSASQITCRDYMDTCYVHVQNDTVVRGCLAQPTTPTAVQTECRRTNSDLCETCSGNNCNGFLIDGEFCLTCDSEIDQNCQDHLNHTMRTQCNLGVRRLGCYRFDDTGGIIKRGCLSHLIPEEVSFCRQQGQFCKTCLGDDCNSKIAFQECKVCNSTQNVDCIRSTQNINSAVCRNYLDECFVHVEDDTILRGCLQQNPGLESDCRDPDVCESCDDRENCNDKIVDGEFCMTCDSELDPNCVDNVNVSMRTQCSLAVTRMGCYLFDDGGDIIKRGCLSDIDPYEVTMCRQEGQFCKTCLGDDCNTKSAFQECKSCNSSQNVDCIRSTHYIESVTCRNYLDNCFTHVQNNQTIRGCLQQNPSFENDCRNPDVCNSCDDRDNCNDAIVDGEFCMTCDSQLDPNCIDNVNISMRTQCSLSVRGMGCYLFDGGEIVKRGCLNDLIPEEVSMCRQQGQFCKTCTGNDCNTKETFQRCRSCTSATDVNCIRSGGSASQITCRDYMDTCYVHVQNDTVVRGCLAQPTTPTAVQTECRRTNSDLCETCSGNNCNGFLIDGEFCLTCDSQIDPNCQDNLNHTMRTQCNLGVRPLGCYRFDDTGDIIKRGCLSHLIPEEISFCRQQGQFCKTCLGDDCNSKVNFQECKVCNSSQNVNCIRSTNDIDSSVCRNYLDECFVHVQDNIVLRGCLQQNPALESDCRNPNVCAACDERENCNDEIVNEEFCITCDSELDPNCIDNVNATMRTECSLAVRGMGCYLFDDGGETVKRGCLSDLIPEEVAMCRQEGQFCKSCNGSDCNQQLKFQRCLSCDSLSNPDCSSPNELTPTSLCRNYLDTCITYFENDRVIRGCSSQRSDLHLSCMNDPSLCSICDSENNCNTERVEEEFCVTCDSELNPDCRNQPNPAMTKQCGAGVKINKIGCYTSDSGNLLQRGCLEDLIPERIELCRREENECKTCIGDNCNLKTSFQRCHVCNSDSDMNCVTLKNMVPIETCRNYLDECKTVTVVGGRTERGCANQLNVIGQILSEECAENNCNANIFPPNRRSCHQCSGPECSSDLSSNNDYFETCRNYDDSEQCFSYVDENREMHRGCASDTTNDRDACRAANQRCVLCNPSGCNTNPATTQSVLSCIQCRNAEEQCAWGYDSTKAVGCSTVVIFPSVESCFTYTEENGTVSRGCTLDNQLCKREDEKCITCNGNACNIQNVATQSCKVCQSDTNGQESCGSEAFAGFEQQCGPIVEYESRGCYTKIEGDTIIRGCAASLTSDEITECMDEEIEQCVYCIENNCNLYLPSHATALKSMSFLTGIIVIFMKMIW